jgi:hypothetical protein
MSTSATPATISTTALPSESGSEVSNSTRDRKQFPNPCASLTIASDRGPTKLTIGPEQGDKHITLKWSEYGGGTATCDQKSYAFPPEAVITVDYLSQITGEPSKSRVIEHKYMHEFTKVEWTDLNMVKVSNQQLKYSRDLGYTEVEGETIYI